MSEPNRFQDENLLLSDFYSEVWVVCPTCAKKAIVKANFENKTVRLFCVHCGYNKEMTTSLSHNMSVQMPASQFFDSVLWLQAAFKKENFWAYNDKHLDYLEGYIGASLREHKDRTHFTLLEKLPKFYHEAKNREPLLKLITKLKNKI